MADKRSDPDVLEDFYDNLQEVVVSQAKRIIDLSMYHNTLLSTLPVALLGTDKKGIIQTTNHAAEEILGFTEDTMKGRLLEELFAPGTETIEKIRDILQSGRPVHLDARNLKLSSDKEIVGNLYVQPLRDDEEEICGILVTVEDLTYVHYLHNAFKQYVPASVSEVIAQNPQSLKLGGEEKVLTVLFSDLVGFSSISERYSPQEIVTLLSDYFTEMTEQVFAFKGTLKEYVGDELMAIFGAPIDHPDHARNACTAALKMQKELAVMSGKWEKTGRPVLKARIGINTGRMLVGNLGSPYRFSYGVVGDQVNLASRLEGLSAIYGTEILIGENTAEMVREAFILREIDQVRVKGKREIVKIYELVAPIDEPIPDHNGAAMDAYTAGLAAYRRQRWTDAQVLFGKAVQLHPEDGPAKVMFVRCQEFKEKPPGKRWDGTFDHEVKK